MNLNIRLSDLTRDPDLRRIFSESERDGGAMLVEMDEPDDTLLGGGAAELEFEEA